MCCDRAAAARAPAPRSAVRAAPSGSRGSRDLCARSIDRRSDRSRRSDRPCSTRSPISTWIFSTRPGHLRADVDIFLGLERADRGHRSFPDCRPRRWPCDNRPAHPCCRYCRAPTPAVTASAVTRQRPQRPAACEWPRPGEPACDVDALLVIRRSCFCSDGRPLTASLPTKPSLGLGLWREFGDFVEPALPHIASRGAVGLNSDHETRHHRKTVHRRAGHRHSRSRWRWA